MPEPDTGRYISVLKKVEIFHRLPDAVIADLAGKMTPRSHRSGDSIIQKGEKGNSMYVIVSGKVKIHDGDMVVAELEAGNFFGEFSLLDEEPRSMSVSAIADTEVGIIRQDDFYQVLNLHADITRDIIRTLVNRLRRQNGKIISQMQARAEELEREVDARTRDLQQKNTELAETLETLRHTQEQLVMQEKLATLGQLTAGIAHEIRNPLNFVNNFSQLSNELMEELEESGVSDDQKEITGLVKENLSKVTEHGKRADNIVKSMMQHARDSSSQRVNANLNKVLLEAVDLAYHGLQSGGKNFDIAVEKSLGENLPEVSLVQQDINRVFLNIISNSFYALKEKVQEQKAGGSDFRPVVTVSSKFENGHIVIRIRDNGTGIPADVLDKIFNPFYTTKPTGQGTGLGLSISNDIVKAHGGTMEVKSGEGEFTEFTIILPVAG